MRHIALLLLALSALLCLDARAATSTRAVPSPFGGNGHNVSFDGRLFILTQSNGWNATVLRPPAVSISNGFADVSQAFAPFTLIQPGVNNENALAICEPDHSRAPYRCDANESANAGGAFDCYDVFLFDSDAVTPNYQDRMRRRRVVIVVKDPGTASASIQGFSWKGGLELLQPQLMGLEPTMTRDGKLLVWQGLPANDGRIDTLVYSTNPTACAMSGWSLPKSITAMNTDPATYGKYRLAERPLRAADGSSFSPGQLFYGAYPWIFPSGEAINFTAVNMPCRSTNPDDPSGCGPRRNALSVIGYPTNWALAHIDGDVNPDVDNTVRLFFSSPTPQLAAPLPVTAGRDVWPFFGSNTSNYTELIFDDGLDGRYAGLWHMNELVTAAGAFDKGRTGDVSGYFNTGTLRDNATFPLRNNGALGKAVELNGAGARVEVPHAASLNPVNALTVELTLKPSVDPNCDGNNNYRLILGKGNIGSGAYSLVFEESREFQARVKVGGVQRSIWSAKGIPVGAFSHVAFTYDAASGELAFFIDGVETNRVKGAPGLLDGSSDPLFIGAPGIRPACPSGDGAFAGTIDEVAISRVVRYGASSPGPDAGTPPDAAAPGPDAAALPGPDAATAGRDAAAPGPDAAAPGLDAGRADAARDAATPRLDAGSADVGSDDVGNFLLLPDSGGAPRDSGGAAATPSTPDGSCGCQDVSGAAAPALALFGLALRRRRS